MDCRVTDYYGREKTVQSRGKKRRRRSADEGGTTVHLSEKEASGSMNMTFHFPFRVTKVLGDTDYVDIKMRVASSI